MKARCKRILQNTKGKSIIRWTVKKIEVSHQTPPQPPKIKKKVKKIIYESENSDDDDEEEIIIKKKIPQQNNYHIHKLQIWQLNNN